MKRISPERKEAILSKLLPPNNGRVAEIAELEGISISTLYNWLHQVKSEGRVVPGSKPSHSEQWTAEAKFLAVVATASMNEEELSSYCRENGLYPEQIERWKTSCIDGARTDAERKRQDKYDSKTDKKRIKSLEKELVRKEKALAETAALLVLRKKLNAYYQGIEEDV